MEKRKTNFKNFKTLSLALLAGATLSACGTIDRLADVGRPPEMAKIENPQLQKDYQPVSMPMPAPQMAARGPNSLWDTNRKSFFKDQRAGNVGDILTVLIQIDDQAELDNQTSRARSGGADAGLEAFLGLEQSLHKILPEAVDNTNLIGMDSSTTHQGRGNTEREEKIEVKLAALITQILPNGNLVIQGKQEVRVNFEKRVLEVAGVIRPEDISVRNTINYDQIAEARIIYGGQGQITDMQQPAYGKQVYDILFPF